MSPLLRYLKGIRDVDAVRWISRINPATDTMATNVLQQPCNSPVTTTAAQQAPLQVPTFKPGTASHPKTLNISVATNGQQEQLSTQFPGIYVPERELTVDEVVEAARLLGRQTKDLGDGQDTVSIE